MSVIGQTFTVQDGIKPLLAGIDSVNVRQTKEGI